MHEKIKREARDEAYCEKRNDKDHGNSKFKLPMYDLAA